MRSLWAVPAIAALVGFVLSLGHVVTWAIGAGDALGHPVGLFFGIFPLHLVAIFAHGGSAAARRGGRARSLIPPHLPRWFRAVSAAAFLLFVLVFGYGFLTRASGKGFENLLMPSGCMVFYWAQFAIFAGRFIGEDRLPFGMCPNGHALTGDEDLFCEQCAAPVIHSRSQPMA